VVEELKLENGKSEEGKDDLKFDHYTRKKNGRKEKGRCDCSQRPVIA
jgi:hypothetical protein